ncbi:MAG: 30S ribosomal protein S17e [Nanoarchaeota archaeon]|nr:30S ribosomal protein S17e [Nanoarchaeota archaeon]
MGRIKTTPIKRATQKIYAAYKDRLKKNFDENKKVVDEVTNNISKPIRNKIAGYATRLMNRGDSVNKPHTPPKKTSRKGEYDDRSNGDRR